MTITLVLGGARSGKSNYAQCEAENTAKSAGGQLVMIATGEAYDQEMAERIKLHQAARGPAWRTVEAPLDLPGAITRLASGDVAVVDCLTLWVSNLLMRDADIAASAKALGDALAAKQNAIWIVSNEVGLGIVPENALARRFRDECGRLHQNLAAQADNVVMLIAGLSMKLK